MGLSLGSSSSTGLTLGGLGTTVTATTSSTPALSLGGIAPTTATTTTAAGLSLGGLATASSTAAAASLTSTTTTSQAASATSNMTFRQLEENINKWTLELEDLEQGFINQATQVNAWDQLLIKNADKIIGLNEKVSSVRLDQQRLEHELDFVAGQQSELEEILKPLEAALSNAGHIDTEREKIYSVSGKEELVEGF